MKKSSFKKMDKKTVLSWVFFVASLSIVIIGVAILPGLVLSWNTTVTGDLGDYQVLGSEEFNVTTSEEGRTSVHLHYEDDDIRTYLDQKSNILWNDSEEGKSSIFVDPGYPEHAFFNGGYQSVVFITNWKISDLIDQNLFNWKLRFNGSKEVQVSLFLSGEDGNGFTDAEGSLWRDNNVQSMNRDFNLDVLDLMYFKTLNGNGYLCFRFTIRSSLDQDPFSIAERFDFQLMYKDPPASPVDVNPYSAWRILAGIEAVVFFIMGVGASPWWNPTDKYNPGPVDKMLSRILRRNKKKSRRRY